MEMSLFYEDLAKKELDNLNCELSIGLFFVNPKGTILYANQSFQNMFGYKMNVLASKELDDLFDIEDIPVVMNEVESISRNETNRYMIKGKTRSNHSISLLMLSHKKINDSLQIISVIDISTMKMNEDQLALQELENLKYALDQASTVSITDPEGNIIYVNDRFCQISKYSREELLGKNHRIIKSGHHPKEVYQKLWDTIIQGKVWRGEVCNRAKDGTLWWGDATIVPFLDKNGKPYKYVGIRSDITEKKNMEERIAKKNEEIRLNEKKFRSLVQNSYDVLAILDRNAIIQYVSANAPAVTGREVKDLIGKSSFDFVKSSEVDQYQLLFDEVAANPQFTKKTEIRLISQDHELNYYEIILTNLLDDPAIGGIVVNLRDITEKVNDKHRIYEMTYYDSLTKLPNRNMLESLLKHEIGLTHSTKSYNSLILFQISNYNFIIESLGIEIGDQLLKGAGFRLKEYVGDTGFLTRFGGNDFALLIPNAPEQTIKHLAMEIIDLFKQPFPIYEYEIYVEMNMGICICFNDPDNIKSIIKNTYSALNQAKGKGTNTFEIYSEHMNIESYKHFTLKSDLRKALKNEEFFIEYQPRIDTKTYKIVGTEALIRWNHPNWGIVSPKEFILIAEENGLINSIGEFVLFKACQQNKKWQEKGLPPIVISVNFSPLQLLEADINTVVNKIIKDTGLDPKWLEIEITETAIMEDESIALENISKLKELGVSIAIDDFGTGYASYSYLKKLKADTLKIDSSFIKALPNEIDNSEIVLSVIDLSQKLKIRTVAEGVDKIEHLHFLKKSHCNEIQGYLFSKPVDAHEMESLLRKGKCKPNQIKEFPEIQPINRRKYFRINLLFPLTAHMSVSELNGEKVKLGSTKISIVNIGPGGIRFETKIRLPVRSDLILKISTTILDEDVEYYGNIVWNQEMNETMQAYGLKFLLNEKERSHLTYLLNRLQVMLRRKENLIP